MGLVTLNNRLITVRDKALSFDYLIEMANQVTGKDDKTLEDAINSLIAGYNPPLNIANNLNQNNEQR